MSAYVIIEFTVKDPDVVREKYSLNAGQTAKEHGGEVLANSNWEIRHGDPMLSSGAIIRFPDHETAVRWYDSPEYQQLIDVRSVAMNARFSLLDGVPSRSRWLQILTCCPCLGSSLSPPVVSTTTGTNSMPSWSESADSQCSSTRYGSIATREHLRTQPGKSCPA
jgi:uncharacterized protein (DUF1330 family)